MSTRVVAAVVALLLVLTNGCDGGREGDRCNPANSSDECGAGLSCQTPSTCVENYCCPADPAKSSNAYCNGSACPPAEAGAAEAGADSGGDAGDAMTSDGGSD